MNGTCMQCDGCKFEVRLGDSHAHAPDEATARAFGWEVNGTEHLCPVCLESREMANEMAEAAVAQSSLILPSHVQQARQQQKRKPSATPGQKVTRLFEKPRIPTPEQQHQMMLEALSGHCQGALAVVRDFLKPPQGLRWTPGGDSPWAVIISREQVKPEEATLPKAVLDYRFDEARRLALKDKERGSNG